MIHDTTPDNRPIIREIIAAIGPGWTAEPATGEADSDYNKTTMIAQNGIMRLWIATQDGRYSTKANRDTYEITGQYPRYSDGTYAAHTGDYIKIRASRQKSPAQVASDIKRRLLPTYTENLKRIAERVKIETLKANRKQTLEDMIAAALDTTAYSRYSGSRSEREIKICPHDSKLPSGEIQVGYNGRINMKLERLDPETAIEIGKVLQQARKWEQATQTATA